MPFAALGLSDPLLRAVEASGYTEPTPIQRQAIPAILMQRDIIGVAQTGTGKTAAFVLPMIDILGQGRARARMPRSLILAPTRELAAQVADNFVKYGKNHRLSMALLIGGVAFGDQDKALSGGVDVLIATPGRLLDQFGRGNILMLGVSILVIDEADRMLDMGFIPDVERICALLPPKRQTLLFSATMPAPVKRLADRFMREPKVIEVARQATTSALIEQRLVSVSPRGKRETLRRLLSAPEVKNAIVFCNRKRDVRELSEVLKRGGFRASQIHGDMEQPERIRELERFKADEISILVASDVAARGLDIKGVSHIVNYDVPHHAEDYVHRIGRTGRAGATGIAITLATPAEAEAVAEVEKLIGQPIPREAGGPVATEEAEAAPAREAPRGRGGRGRGSRERDEERPAEERPTEGRSARGRDRRRPAAEPPARAADAEVRTEPAPPEEARAEPAPRDHVRAERAPREVRAERAPAPRAAEPAEAGDWEGPVPSFLHTSARG